MNSAKSDYLKRIKKYCSICHTKIKIGEEYNHHSKILCEDCCMDRCAQRVRKTHWQYLRSIKTEYLIPGKNV